MWLSSSIINTDCLTPNLGRSISCPANIVPPHLTGNDKGLYATMNRWRIDPSSCLDTCWVDDMAVWWFRATCFHGLKYLCVNREVLKTKSLWKQKWKYQTSVCTLPMYSWLVVVWMQANHRQWHCLLVTSTVKTWNPRFTFGVRGTSFVPWIW